MYGLSMWLTSEKHIVACVLVGAKMMFWIANDAKFKFFVADSIYFRKFAAENSHWLISQSNL